MLELSSEVNPAIASRIGRPRSVLELGCGAGVNGMLARKVGARVVGVEADPELAERASLVLDEVLRIDPLNLDALERALRGQSFDLVLIPTALERAAEPARLVALAATFIAPEGRLIYATRNSDAWALRLGVESTKLGFGALGGVPDRYYSAEEARSFARLAGLTELELGLTPLLLKSLRAVLSEDVYASLRRDEAAPSGFRDFALYEAYRDRVLPFEVKAATLAPSLLAYQHVVVARKPPLPGPLALTVGMLTMDEEPSVARMIEQIQKYSPEARILCVDSSARDQTPRIAERLGARVLRQLPPQGHGPAMELLMYEAARESDALVYLDCDFTYPPEDIPKLVRILESGVDVVNAARIRSRPEAMPLANYLANKAFAWCAWAMNGAKVSDLHSGMRGYRASLIRSFAFDGSGDALPIDTLLWPLRSGYRVVEIPMEYQERVGISKLRKVAGTVWTFVRLGRTLKVGSRKNGDYEIWDSPEGPRSP